MAALVGLAGALFTSRVTAATLGDLAFGPDRAPAPEPAAGRGRPPAAQGEVS